eukprot:UC4_evm1s1316
MEDLSALSTKELKTILKTRGISVAGCFERSDFLEVAKKNNIDASTEQSSSTSDSKSPSFVTQYTRLSGLQCKIHKWTGTEAKLAVIMAHGYGADNDQFEDLARSLVSIDKSLQNIVWVSPMAPSNNEWFPLQLTEWSQIMMGARGQDAIAQFIRNEIPGMDASSHLLQDLSCQVAQKFNLDAKRVLLGGFSQGAMMAVDASLGLNEGPGGIIVLSGFPLTVDKNYEKLAKKKGLRVFQSHGTSDMILPFFASSWLRDLFKNTGTDLTWVEHSGGHDLGGITTLQKLAQWLASF